MTNNDYDNRKLNPIAKADIRQGDTIRVVLPGLVFESKVMRNISTDRLTVSLPDPRGYRHSHAAVPTIVLESIIPEAQYLVFEVPLEIPKDADMVKLTRRNGYNDLVAVRNGQYWDLAGSSAVYNTTDLLNIEHVSAVDPLIVAECP